MPKVVLLKNQTLNDIELFALGETLPASGVLEVSTFTAPELRLDLDLIPLITSGAIIVNDGLIDLSAKVGTEYIANEVISDDDGFWYTSRRRFSLLWKQPAHGFIPGQVIKMNESTSLATLALADSHANSATTAIVGEIIDVDNFYAALTGATVKITDANAIAGGLPLIIGQAYYLSSTVPGQLTPSPPIGAGEIVKLTATAIDIDTVIVFTYAGYENESALPPNIVSLLSSSGNFIRPINTWLRSVINSGSNDPALLTPINGDRYLIGTSPIGQWLNKTGFVAEFISTTGRWYFTPPKEGYIVVDTNIPELLYYDGSVWIPLINSSPSPASRYINQTFHDIIPVRIGTSKVPKDSSIPLITEGTEIWSQAIVPASLTSIIKISNNVTVSSSKDEREVVFVLFRDSICIGTVLHEVSEKKTGYSVSFTHTDTPNTISSTVYSVRVGRTANTGTWYINSIHDTVNAFGGTLSNNGYLIEELVEVGS